ncbi:MAG: glutamine-hydrolyzing carbamoyl-phosphate synthase small subunit [Gammaproteobacteria bacterium]|nr:glutamine-hydrolyzing carbamoyl-phosphate synthase small subunit [Gammaproteobacteria bacterium]
MEQDAALVLADGTVFRGTSIGKPGLSVGEVVFNTAMTGYQEILSDPSYCRQIVTLTYPHIGNTGVNAADMESAAAQCAGLVIRDLPLGVSSWRREQDLDDFLRQQGVVAIAGIDTRKLTRILRDKGAQHGSLVAGDIDIEAALEAARAFGGLSGVDLAREVSTREVYEWSESTWDLDHKAPREAPPADYHVVAFDFGIKRNILRLLVDAGCRVTVVPASTPVADVLPMRPDGIFLSNGPGDPFACDYAIAAVRELLTTGIPIFGICLGFQILALASGAKTEKMKFGHHGANHPVRDEATGRVLITSQNHGFAVSEEDLPAQLRVTHRSLFDNSLQGIERTDCPAFAFQGHPEASPGPHEARALFGRFIELMAAGVVSVHANAS